MGDSKFACLGLHLLVWFMGARDRILVLYSPLMCLTLSLLCVSHFLYCMSHTFSSVSVPSELCSLLKQCLELKPKNRITAEDAWKELHRYVFYTFWLAYLSVCVALWTKKRVKRLKAEERFSCFGDGKQTKASDTTGIFPSPFLSLLFILFQSHLKLKIKSLHHSDKPCEFRVKSIHTGSS